MGVEHLPAAEAQFAFLRCCCASPVVSSKSTCIPHHFLLSYISHNNNNSNNNSNVDFFLTIVSFTFMFPTISL